MHCQGLATHEYPKKPKWTLISGVGPGLLELDRSRSMRIYKLSLRAFGIETKTHPQHLYDPGQRSPEEHRQICDAACDFLMRCPNSSSLLIDHVPLFDLWGEIEQHVISSSDAYATL